MRDIWIISEVKAEQLNAHDHAFEVQHHQLDGSNWRAEGVMPWTEFIGSHKALSSFSMPDTVVYLGLEPSNKADVHTTQIWMAICDSPSSLLYATLQSIHLTLIEQVQSMGKDVIVCGLRKGSAQLTAHALGAVLTLVSQTERQEVEKWLRKKATNHTVVNVDWSLGLSLLVRGKENWLKSRLTTGALIVALTSGGIHLALEGLRTQGQRLSLQHKQMLNASEFNKRAIEKPIDWEWLARTLNEIGHKNSPLQNQAHSLSLIKSDIEQLALYWETGGDMHTLIKTGDHKGTQKTERSGNRIPEGCKTGRQGWMACSNATRQLPDDIRE